VGVVLLDPPSLGWMMGEDLPELRELFVEETAAMRAQAGAARASSEPAGRAQAAFWEALASEHEEFFAQSAQQAGAIRSFGQLPLTVIGATEPDPRLGESSAAFRQFWNAESRKLAAKSERGRFILAEGSSHHLHLDAPQLVRDAIRELFVESRALANLGLAARDMPSHAFCGILSRGLQAANLPEPDARSSTEVKKYEN
jgi:pimeloyl-ACP methyl ester carboxylesterase